MENHRYPVLSLYILLSLLLLSTVSSFSPVDHYLVNCGSNEAITIDIDNRRFIGDSSARLPGTSSLLFSRAISLHNSKASPTLSPIYSTARVFSKPSQLVFKIRDKGTQLVRLHFYRFDSPMFNTGDFQFRLVANEFQLLYDFTGENARNAPVVKEYMIWVDSEELIIQFTPSGKSNFGFVNAIEVISAPKDLVADVAMLVNSEKVEKISGLKKTAFETVYRVNVGGPKVTPFNDSLWRTWIPDDEFLKFNDGLERVHFGGRIKYQMGGASREVGPDNVYNTARVIRSLNDLVPQSNISWEFPVTEGYKYLVRMHFCDIASISLGQLYFNVYVNGKLAYENLDLSTITNSVLASPFYADFVVDVENSGVLTVGVGPSNMSLPHAIDAILNGVEIMKMSNSMGSLDGEVFPKAVYSRVRRLSSIAVVLSFLAVVGVLTLVFLVVLGYRSPAHVKGSVVWLPVPVDIPEDDLKCPTQPSLVKV